MVDHKVTSDTYQRAIKVFGAKKLVDLMGLIGNYSARTSWETNGRAGPEQTVLYFRWSDPVGFLPSRVAIGER